MNAATDERTVAQAPWWYLYMISILAAIGGFLFGYDLSIITGAMLFLQDYFGLSPSDTGGLTASAIFGCIFGALVAVYVADKVGRRRSLFIAGVLFLISSVWSAIATGLFEFYVARAIGGVGVGIATGVSPMFIAEISPAKLRGRMVTVNQLSIVVGIVTSILVALFLSRGGHWRLMFASEVVPNVLLLMGLAAVPESPRWLAARGRFDGALRILSRINGAARAREELDEIRSQLTEETGSFRELLQPGVRYALITACILMIFQQINGVNMILLYGAKILVEAGIGSPTDALRNALYPNTLILICTVVAFYVVARFPRRHILMTGVTGMALGHLLMSFAFYTESHRPLLSVLAMLVAAGSFTLTLAPVGWVVVSEFFPNRVRGKCMGVVTFFLFTSSFFCALWFPRITAGFERAYGTQSGAYLVFAGICLACVFFVWKFIPETKDMTLEDIGRFWLRKGKLEAAAPVAASPSPLGGPDTLN